MVSKKEQNKMFLELRLNDVIDGESRMGSGIVRIEFQMDGADTLKACLPMDNLVAALNYAGICLMTSVNLEEHMV